MYMIKQMRFFYRYIALSFLLVIILSLSSGCTTNRTSEIKEEPKPLEFEFKFRNNTWYDSDYQEIQKEIEEAFPSFRGSQSTGLFGYDDLKIYQYHYRPKDKKTKEYIQGKELNGIYIDFLIKGKRPKEYSFLSGAYEFNGGRDLFEFFKEYLTSKYGESSELKTRYDTNGQDYMGHKVVEDLLLIDAQWGKYEYVLWRGANKSTLELSVHIKNDKPLKVFIKYYIEDGFEELEDRRNNEIDEKIRTDNEKKKESIDNDDL